MVGLARGGSGSDSGSGSDRGWEWEVEGGRDGGCDREGVVVWRRLLPSRRKHQSTRLLKESVDNVFLMD